MATNASTSRARLSYIEEVTFGTTPAGNLQKMRWTSESLKQTNTPEESKEIRDDRQIGYVARVDAEAGGDVGIEMSYGAHDDLLAGLMMNTWASITTGAQADLAAAAGHVTSTSTDLTVFPVGAWIQLSAGWSANLGKIVKVVSATTTDLTVVGDTLVTEAAAAGHVVSTSRLVVGTTLKSFSIERAQMDLAEAERYATYPGCRVKGASLNITPGSLFNGNFSFMGLRENRPDATIGTGYTNAPTADVWNTVDNISAIREGGAAVTFRTTGITLNIENGMWGQKELAVLGSSGIGVGTFRLTGTLGAYFETKALLNKALNWTASDIAFRSGDGAGNKMVWDVPKLYFTQGTSNNPGMDQDVKAEMEFQAFLNASQLTTLGLYRFPAA